ncbi:hypothetical protein D3C73_1485700 [compost metagenome]
MLRTVGSSFGTAISSAILATHAGLNGEATPSGINMTFMLGAVLCIALGAALLVNSAIRTSRTTYSAPLRVD